MAKRGGHRRCSEQGEGRFIVRISSDEARINSEVSVSIPGHKYPYCYRFEAVNVVIHAVTVTSSIDRQQWALLLQASKRQFSHTRIQRMRAAIPSRFEKRTPTDRYRSEEQQAMIILFIAYKSYWPLY